MNIDISIRDWKHVNEPNTVAVMLALAVEAELGKDICISEIARRLKLTRIQMRYALEKLESTGVITREQTGHASFKITFNKYIAFGKAKPRAQTRGKAALPATQGDLFSSVPLAEFERLRRKKSELTEDEETRYATAQGKRSYGAEDFRNVWLLDREVEKLVEQYGRETANTCICTLSFYKKENGKTYKDDYAAIRNWVVTRVTEEQAKQSNTNEHNQSAAELSRTQAYRTLLAFQSQSQG